MRRAGDRRGDRGPEATPGWFRAGRVTPCGDAASHNRRGRRARAQRRRQLTSRGRAGCVQASTLPESPARRLPTSRRYGRRPGDGGRLGLEGAGRRSRGRGGDRRPRQAHAREGQGPARCWRAQPRAAGASGAGDRRPAAARGGSRNEIIGVQRRRGATRTEKFLDETLVTGSDVRARGSRLWNRVSCGARCQPLAGSPAGEQHSLAPPEQGGGRRDGGGVEGLMPLFPAVVHRRLSGSKPTSCRWCRTTCRSEVRRDIQGALPVPRREDTVFHVNREKGFFHCFGCGVGGDVFKFVELQEKVGSPTPSVCWRSVRHRRSGTDGRWQRTQRRRRTRGPAEGA